MPVCLPDQWCALDIRNIGEVYNFSGLIMTLKLIQVWITRLFYTYVK